MEKSGVYKNHDITDGTVYRVYRFDEMMSDMDDNSER